MVEAFDADRDECLDPPERAECVLGARCREPLGVSDK